MVIQKSSFVLIVSVLLTISHAHPNYSPFSDELIDFINTNQLTWRAGQNFHKFTSKNYIKQLTGVLPKDENLTVKLPLKILTYAENEEIPESFDARERWPECADVIGDIRDQGECGGCWAFGAAEVMSDRICIVTNGTRKISISSQDLLTCCFSCGFGCGGGWPENTWHYWTNFGVSTGGGYQSEIGCKSYTIEPCDHHVNGTLRPCSSESVVTPECIETCDEGYDIEYSKDKYTGSSYTVSNLVEQIQLEIMQNGPVGAGYKVYDDFYNYKDGVYMHFFGGKYTLHSVKIIGWGVEDSIPYWLVANSWNSEWGDNGYFKILRGLNECDIESAIVAGIPQL